jgi:hypothetical protein
MIFVARPTPGTLCLIDSDVEPAGPLTYAVPDAEFWAWLDKGEGKPYLAKMTEQNADRLRRARLFVGVLRSEKAILTDAGFTRSTLASKRPPAVAGVRPTLITAAPKEIDDDHRIP